MADANSSRSSSEEDSVVEDPAVLSDHQPQNMKKAGDTTSTNMTAKDNSANSTQRPLNDLPEDKEIQSDDDE